MAELLWALGAYLLVGFVVAVVDRRVNGDHSADPPLWVLAWPVGAVFGVLFGAGALVSRAVDRIGTPRHVREERRRKERAAHIARLEREAGIWIDKEDPS